ncbi:hypothetical protein AURDEDRAFT_130019 [Auricularia subglabra TFB-10046 SS5]|uniref:Uncharacterized protein n=1 Tax=Auricularia subglabra (strain TFB-10046 / SS5) TaxID=717982 RepID=J0LG78_AURST|nr:hypothetical protein AURDEDRAFT_130019 [Auricularia subglabra TFB-10046 SS5]
MTSALFDKFDEKVILSWPVGLPSVSEGDTPCILYFSTIVRKGLSKTICKTVFVPHCDVHPYQAPNSSANTQPDGVAPSLLWPTLIAGGVVHSGVLAVVQPSLHVHDIAVPCADLLMGALIAIRCTPSSVEQLDDEEMPLHPGAMVIIRGRICDITDGCLSIDVKDVRLEERRGGRTCLAMLGRLWGGLS